MDHLPTARAASHLVWRSNERASRKLCMQWGRLGVSAADLKPEAAAPSAHELRCSLSLLSTVDLAEAPY